VQRVKRFKRLSTQSVRRASYCNIVSHNCNGYVLPSSYGCAPLREWVLIVFKFDHIGPNNLQSSLKHFGENQFNRLRLLPYARLCLVIVWAVQTTIVQVNCQPQFLDYVWLRFASANCVVLINAFG
jgi:hypothetical protein